MGRPPKKDKVIKKPHKVKKRVVKKIRSNANKDPKDVPLPTSTRVIPLKNKRSENKFFKISENETVGAFSKVWVMVKNKELVWSHYERIDNEGFHYYLKTNKKIKK